MPDIRLCGAIPAALALVITAAPARAACWKPDQVAAAKVRDLETMLMVSALRCRNSADDFMARYNGFVVASRPALAAVNTTLRGHYEASMPKAAALNAYDRFVVRIANRYGGGAEGLGCSDMASILDATAAQGESVKSLTAVAERAGVVPVLDEAECPVQIAALPR